MEIQGNSITTSSNETYHLYVFTGKVLESSKNLETRVSGSGGGGFVYKGTGGSSDVTIRSRTLVHDQLFLLSETGEERSFQLQDFNLACRADQNLSIFWAIKQGDEYGPYLAVYNHNTNNIFFQHNVIDNMFSWRPLQKKTSDVLIFCLCILGYFLIIPLIFAYRRGKNLYEYWKSLKTEKEQFKNHVLSLAQNRI
ncbi:hypothetical protein [Flavobacterium caeni]|uniref:Uncharacterized protein n=1 Tax=Flavobacterium caeni TaxID=490189 RepID=A0A1G5E953_9FLAO|nr:hypothetical protein [Flavobacterium caeni]SCY23038.1 hypothetical protein SAMN02927903_00973 [Flavobacterium caeni]